MAKDADLKLTVGAEKVKGSGEEVVNEIEKDVNKAVKSKGGHIKVPVDITIPIDKDKAKLTQAQMTVVKKLNKMTSKGFSASGKDLDDLISKFNNFTTLLDKSGKGRQNSVYREIRKRVESLEKQYRDVSTVGKSTKIKTSNRSTKQKKNTVSQEMIDAALNKSYEDYKARVNKHRRLEGIKRIEPKGYKRNYGFDTGVATDETIQASDFSPYRSNWARQMNISKIAAVKWMKDSLKQYKNNELANKLADEAIAKNRKKRGLSNREASLEQSQNISDELAKILGGLEHKREDVSVELFEQYLNGLLKYNGEAGNGVWNGILLSLNKTFNRYASKGAIGATDGTNRGEAEGHATAMSALSRMINIFKKVSQQDRLVKIGEKELKISAEQERQLRELAKVDERAANKYVDELLKGETTTTKQKAESTSQKETVKSNSQLRKDINNLNKTNKETTAAIEKQTSYDKIEHDAERVADKTLETVETTDANDGFNSESNAKELTEAVKSLGTDGMAIGTESIKKIIRPKGTALNGDACKSILEVISNNVKAIAEYLGGKATTVNTDTTDITDTASKSNSVHGSYKFFGVKGLMEGMIPPIKALSTTVEKSGLPDLYRYFKDGKWLTAGVVDHDKKQTETWHDKTDYKRLSEKMATAAIEREREQIEKGEHPSQQKSNQVEQTRVLTYTKSLFDKLAKILGIGPSVSEVSRITQMSPEERAKETALRLEKYGETRGRDLSDTGDIASFRRRLSMFGRRQDRIDSTEALFQNVQLTKGLKPIDTTDIMSGLQKGLQAGMFEAQTGGIFRNIIGPMTGYLGMESLEKSRAKAEGLNQVLSNTRQQILDLINDIQGKERTLQQFEIMRKSKV